MTIQPQPNLYKCDLCTEGTMEAKKMLGLISRRKNVEKKLTCYLDKADRHICSDCLILIKEGKLMEGGETHVRV